jgi:hypothetical protein
MNLSTHNNKLLTAKRQFYRLMTNLLNEDSYKYKLFFLIKKFCEFHQLEVPTKKNMSNFLIDLYEDESFDLIKRSEQHRNYTQSQLNKFRVQLISKYGEKCMKCKSENNIEVDHIIPYSWDKSISLNYDNLQLLCKTCNTQKSNRNSINYRLLLH